MPTPPRFAVGGGLLHRRVVVEDVLQPLDRHRLHEVGADHRVDQSVGSVAEAIEAVARHRVSGDDDDLTVVLDPVADRRVHRPMVGGSRHDAHAALVVHDALDLLGHDHCRIPRQVLVVVEPVGDVRGQRVEQPVDNGGRAGGPEHAERLRLERGHPAAGDHVVEVGDVVAVEVGQDQRRQLTGLHADRGGSHQHAAAAVEQERGSTGSHEGGGPRPVGIDERAAGAEEDDLDHA